MDALDPRQDGLHSVSAAGNGRPLRLDAVPVGAVEDDEQLAPRVSPRARAQAVGFVGFAFEGGSLSVLEAPARTASVTPDESLGVVLPADVLKVRPLGEAIFTFGQGMALLPPIPGRLDPSLRGGSVLGSAAMSHSNAILSTGRTSAKHAARISL